jgi:hypothetical protein
VAFDSGGKVMSKQNILLGVIVAAILFAVAGPQYGQKVAVSSSGADRAKHMLAIGVLRTINTAEAARRMEHGSYVDWDELIASQEFVDYFAKWATQNKDQLSGAHLTKGPEILPGWSLRLDLTDGGKGYDLLLEDTTDKACGYAAGTDERGVIRQSKSIDCEI